MIINYVFSQNVSSVFYPLPMKLMTTTVYNDRLTAFDPGQPG